MAKDEHTGRKIAIGALFAGIAGYIGGLLTAPKSGKETRADIANKAGEIKEDAQEQLQNLHDEIDKLLDTARLKTAELSSQAKEELNEAIIRAKNAQSKTKVVLKAVKDGKADDPQLNKAIKQAKQAKKNLSKYLKN